MAQAARLSMRMQKELKLLLTDPPPGASFPLLSAESDLISLSTMDAQIEGPEGTVYAKGKFNIKIEIPERYPFQPPIVTFTTPIYHPNIDNGGRICLDILNLPPKGAWQPSLNISTILMSIGLLLSEPNPDDGLMCEASKEYKYNRQAFDQKARSMTDKYARAGLEGISSSSQGFQTNSNPSLMTDLDKESTPEAKEVVTCHKKLFGISQKLSLESSSFTQSNETDGKMNDVSDEQFSLCDFENQSGKRKRKDLKEIIVEFNHNNIQGTRRKLSLASGLLKRDDNLKEDDILNQSSSFCETANKDYSGSSVFQTVTSHAHKLDINGQKVSVTSGIKLSTRLCQVGKKELEPQGTCQHDGKSLKIVAPNQELPTEVCSHISDVIPASSNCKEQQPHKGSITRVRLENVSKDTNTKKRCSVEKKTSLGFKVSSQKPDNKENAMAVTKLQLSDSHIVSVKNNRNGKLHSGPLTQLLGPNDDLTQELLQPKILPSYVSKPSSPPRHHEKGQITRFQNVKDPGVLKEKNAQDNSLHSELIVVDSEDSDEERKVSLKSKLSLARRIGKRKAKS